MTKTYIDKMIDGIFGPGEESDACSSVTWTDDEKIHEDDIRKKLHKIM